MKRQAADLLAAAERFCHDRPQRHAVILDLSGLLHIDDPAFRRTLNRWLVGDGKPGADGSALTLFDIGHDKLVLILPESLLAERRQALTRVASALAQHHRGTINARWFDLRQQGEAFADAVRHMISEIVEEEYPHAPPAADALDLFMEIERTLHSVDLSSLVREQMIFRLDGVEDLVPVMMERTIAIDALDRLFATRLHRDPWLFDQVTTLLDRRMLFDLLRDRAVHSIPVAVKLHAATVAGEEFREMTARFPARLHGKLVVEMPFLEWAADSETFQKALIQARADEIGVAIDHVPARAPSDLELPHADWYRIPWLGEDGAVIDMTGGIAWLGPVDRKRCILSRCRDDQALADARTLGFQYVQGAAATRAFQDGIKVGDEQRRDAVISRPSVEAEAETDAKAGAQSPPWWARLFRGKASG